MGFSLDALRSLPPNHQNLPDFLLEGVWGERYVGSRRTVDIHVRRLRAKLGPGLELETVRGWDYRLRIPTAEDPPAKLRRASRTRRVK